MSREVRMVPPDWQHPMEEREQWDRTVMGLVVKNVPRPLHDRSFADELADFAVNPDDWDNIAPQAEDYMPEFPPETATHYMMYETTSEGTPISPAFATPEELARWLTDNHASAFGGAEASYEQWLATCKGGWAPSMVVQDGVMMSGVQFIGQQETDANPA